MGESKNSGDAVAAEVLWRMKTAATKEVQTVRDKDFSSSKSFEHSQSVMPDPTPTPSSHHCEKNNRRVESNFLQHYHIVPRSRTIPVGSSADMGMPSNGFSPLIVLDPSLASIALSPLSTHQKNVLLDHFDWADRSSSSENISTFSSSLVPSAEVLSSAEDSVLSPKKKDEDKHCTVKPKMQSFVGQSTTSSNITVKGVLRKKFSWKQFPELEEYLQLHRDEYFEYSALNYTAEQRKYNNTLTRGLLKVASEEGYIFQDFTFAMVRDRIRCYYKSHAQAAKKKAKLHKK